MRPATKPTDHLALKHLRLIVAIADHDQLSIAAGVLGLTQPAASRALAEAEARVGAALFDRTPKGMVATPVGESLVRRARNVLDELADAMTEVDRLRLGRGGVVRIGAVTGAAVAYVAPAIRRLRDLAPEVEVYVDVGTSEDLIAGLTTLRHDMVLGRVPPRMATDGFQIRQARGEEICIVANADHPAAGRGPVALTDLAGNDWVMQGPGAPIRRAVEEALLTRGAALPRHVTNTASLLMALALLRAPDVVTAVSREVAQLLTDGGGRLVLLPLDQPIRVAPYALVTLRARRLSPTAARCAEVLADLLARG